MVPSRALRRFDEQQEHLLEHGLVLSNVPFPRWTAGKAQHGTGRRGIITSEGCACEAYERALAENRSSEASKIFLKAAPIYPAKEYGEEKIEIIKAGKVLGLLFIQGEGSRLGDCVVDLSRESSFPAYVLAGCTKSALIADWQWKRLLIHSTVSQWRQQPEALFREDLLESASDAA